ncbi:protein bark beetle-like isoform X1 [Anopheles albimanus]|uniref:protein bark beetle-like isoform X1 n=1 Tax=Anopheles albimanus TaxID=7167 RepID=UPI001640D126|nr:protein bark beetle-like isoform X1 [Anopheles albimanus]XP_035780256.1 protein bark beetle-like isoform X1 [Anopheles albimanus]XP_035780258.1 protein bark beetle-like isoform X1 [Anopheles albimanus]XP_035780259.1 protein bark beetle-like isoform X1 [Anopheles albimanus]
MANPANGARRTVKCWKNRLKDPATAGASVLLLIVLFASAIQCQVEEIDVFDVDHPPNNHPDRDFEHVPVPSSKEIITNHIVPGHREEDAVSGGHHGGTGDSHYQFGQDDHHSVVSASGSAKYTEIVGDVVLGEKVLRASESPYSLRTDLEVERRARLIIEAGVTIHFAPMVGITVRGSIVAMGTAENKILLTSLPDTGYEDVLADPREVGVRLVDGPSPLAGRLQLLNRGKWRSVCSNSKNWTIADYETTCRQMGYKGGRFWNWMDRIPNYEPRLLYEEPRCHGTEASLFDCAWSTRQIGSGVCDYHSDIGVQCLPLFDHVTPHWRGLKFENAENKETLSHDHVRYDSISLSHLRHVDIVRAGTGRGGTAESAIAALGVPPVLDHVTIDHSSYTGINVTRHEAAFSFRNVTVRRSRGFGIFMNSSYGSAHLEGVTVSENGADGIRYVGHDLRASERTDRSKVFDFCTLTTTAWQIYPLQLSFEQSPFALSQKECARSFETGAGNVLTMHFVYFEVTRNETAQISVYDGMSENDRLLATWNVRNSTRPQSVTSTREKLFIKLRADPRAAVLAHFRVTSGHTKAYDLNVTQATIVDNGGRGIAVDNLRSQVHVHSSTISNNRHVAGLHVTSGVGDINVTDSRISFNQGDGINITYYGGNRNVSRSSVISNRGYGFAIWLNQTTTDRREYLEFNQTSTIEYSSIARNLEIGILHGNYCGDAWVNVTGNWFNDSKSDAIDIQSCWFETQENQRLRLQIGHNNFEHSNRIAIVISPILNLEGRIEFNHFTRGRYGALLTRNRAWEEFRALPVRLIVQHNHFMQNEGIYVASLGLSPNTDSKTQWMLFTRNFVKGNRIKEAFGPLEAEGEGLGGEGRLNPRSRVAAPVVISSNNVDVFRNIISNHESQYEVGSQLSDQSKALNVTYNWLGNQDEEKIYDRLFHRKDRYDLAKIEYFPYLLHHSNPGTQTIAQYQKFVPFFHKEGSERIGGEVDGQEILPPGTYTVERDINVRPGGKLILSSGVTLNFAPSVGMMVTGKLEARGRSPDDILFTLKREAVMVDNDTTEAIAEDPEFAMDIETESIVEKGPQEPQIPKVPVRLVGGENDHEGRLQVYTEGVWGTVCDYGWTITNAALVCHQLGLALNPMDWRLQRSEVPGAGTTEDVLLSNVRCTEHDIDISKCRAERASQGDFEHSCGHDNDVGVRCYEGAWAGLRFGVLAERADLQYVTIEKAGLFDYVTNTFKPALQMDLARHNLDSVRIVENLQDGLGIIYSDIYAGSSVNNVKNSEFAANRGNGISIKQLGLKVHGSIIKDNRGSGINHDLVVSSAEQREITSWFSMVPDFNVDDSDYRPILLPENGAVTNIDIDQWQIKHIITTARRNDPVERQITIRCQPGYVIGIQLLNPIENRSTENIWIYDSLMGSTESDIWQVNRDLSVFPLTTSSYGAILQYRSGTNALGGAVLVLRSIQAPVQNIYNRIVRGPVPTLQVTSTKIQRNFRGITGTYYNRYLGEKSELYLRKANESIRLVNCEISHNREEAIFIHSPFWDVHVSNISEVTIHVNNSMIRDNGRGIRQFSKDLRSSNNLFHYVLQDTTVESNSLGGLELSLPYVWQYNENFTHSVYLGNDTWARNRKFGILIDGHYAAVNITGNIFTENQCAQGLIGFRGMEKKMRIDNNRITRNYGSYMVEFRSDSQSEILGEIPALLAFNHIESNEQLKEARGSSVRNFIRGERSNANDPTCVIGFGGVQKVQIYRNVISNNQQDYDLIAGVKSARLRNYLDARENWWGSMDELHIRKRIFDFDDWNNHAEALYRPYLVEDVTDGSISVSTGPQPPVDLDALGGRILTDLAIYRRDQPYVIRSDITVMPGVTFSIYPGVVMEFAPNVGILVLGTLLARGTSDAEVIMKPIENAAEGLHRVERSLENMVNYDSIRLCTNRNCSMSENEAERAKEGFLEYYNHTTLQWIPICDRRFTERNAQVVCRELGYDPLDVFFGHDRRIEFHTNSLTRIWSWVEPMECHGDELRLEECPERLNGQLYGRRHECQWDSEFVFISCNGEPERRPYWGGVRFANPDFEASLYEHRIHDAITHSINQPVESVMDFVRVERAGMLHGEKSPAVQTIAKNPSIQSVTIRDSAHHGVNLISPTNAIHLNHLQILRTLGQGINAISLTGEGRESDESSYSPLKDLDLPYNLFSLIDICDTNKEITLEERVLVYYKYDNNPVNCVKIFKSAYRVKPLGFRLLQSNLFNHSKEYGRRDMIQLMDGDIYNVSSRLIGTVDADSDNQKRLFRTIEPALSIRLIASGAPARHGFIAEVVTLPISAIGFNRDAQHNISNTEITGCVGGALQYTSVGEVSPILTLERNRILRNCRQLYGNFSSCESAIRIDVQNMQSLHFRNNLIQGNQGGVMIRADSRGSATSLRGWLHHNLFARNRNRPAIYVDGRQSSPYQEVIIHNNYITQNDATFRDVIVLRQVVSNFTHNYVHRNRGLRIVQVSGFDRVRLPIYQTTTHNGFYDNVATDWEGRATIVAGTAGQHYVDNIFANPDNDYEMITVNRSITDFQYWNSTLDVWKTKIDARHNYWSYNETLAVSSRIRDRLDDPQLLEVSYLPLHMNNQTVLDGKCPPGWTLLIDTCYMYVGAPMSFREARDFCRSDNASLPFIHGDTTLLWQFLDHQSRYLRNVERVWVQDANYIDRCTSFIYRNVEVEECHNRHAFLCEIDPKVEIDPLHWTASTEVIGIIVALCLVVVLIFIVCICWCCKSRYRQEQRLQRRNSIRQSMRSLNSIDPQGSLRRRNYAMSRSTDTLRTATTNDYKRMASNGSIESVDKSVLSTETSYDMYDHKQKQQYSNEYAEQLKSQLGYSESNGVDGEYLANGTGSSVPLKTKVYGVPEYNSHGGSSAIELAFRNEGFRDTSTTYSGVTRNNSLNTAINEDTPIIHAPGDIGESGSDYYGNSSTLPMRVPDKLSFLSELKHHLPEYEPPSPISHSSFQPARTSQSESISSVSAVPPYAASGGAGLQRTLVAPPRPAPPAAHVYQQPTIQVRRPAPPEPEQMRRPDSYMKAVKKYATPGRERDSILPPPPRGDSQRPKTVYESSDEQPPPVPVSPMMEPGSRANYARSKSEALLETNFDGAGTVPAMLSADSRSYSQPLETAM